MNKHHGNLIPESVFQPTGRNMILVITDDVEYKSGDTLNYDGKLYEITGIDRSRTGNTVSRTKGILVRITTKYIPEF